MVCVHSELVKDFVSYLFARLSAKVLIIDVIYKKNLSSNDILLRCLIFCLPNSTCDRFEAVEIPLMMKIVGPVPKYACTARWFPVARQGIGSSNKFPLMGSGIFAD